MVGVSPKAQAFAGLRFNRSVVARSFLMVASGLIVLVMLAACTASGGGSANSADRSSTSSSVGAQAKADAIPTAIVLDASGSMRAKDAPGQRFAAAQKAFNSLLDAIPDGQETSLITYGTSTGNSDAEISEGCRDVSTLIPAGKVDKKKFADAVNGLKPSGYTPIALALKEASRQLPDSGKRAIILLSDGIDTCADEGDKLDPCQVAEDLGADKDLAIHTVGFRVDGQTSKQLECLSNATNGTSLDAVNDKQLSTRFAMTVNPQLADTTLTPKGYKGLTPGMTADEAKQAGGFSNKVASSGRVEIIYFDCTLVFIDGILSDIVSENTPTVDGIRPGDDVSAAEEIYGNPDLPTEVTDDGAALFTADPIAGTGFKMYFEGADDYRVGKPLKGKITRIVICSCMTTDSYSVAPPPVGIFPGCMIQTQCTITDAVQVQHPKQGPLTLVLLARDDGLSDQWGKIFVVDATGRITDTAGQAVRWAQNAGTVWPTYLFPADQLAENFRFMRPVTDRSGMVFLVGPAEDAGTYATAMSMEPDGYFSEEEGFTIDYDSIPDSRTQEYWSEEWGGIDENGFFERRLYDGADEIILTREGDKYVRK